MAFEPWDAEALFLKEYSTTIRVLNPSCVFIDSVPVMTFWTYNERTIIISPERQGTGVRLRSVARTFISPVYLLALALFAPSCSLELIGSAGSGSGGAGAGGGGEACSAASSASLQALYTGFDNWNDYVRKASTSTACDGSEVGPGGYWNCIHAGERKRVNLTGVTDCTGITASDSLGAFEWLCDDSGAEAFVYSQKLKSGKGLADLIDPVTGTAFLSNSVTVTQNSCAIFKTPSSSTWWGNAFAVLPNVGTATAFQTLNSAGTIYTLPDGVSGGTNGFDLDADRIALVTLGDAVLNFYGTDADAFNGTNTIVGVDSNRFTWIEGKFLGKPDTVKQAEHGIYLRTADFTRLHRVFVDATDEAGVYAVEGENILMNELTVSNASENRVSLAFGGIVLFNAAGNINYVTILNSRVSNVVEGPGLISFGETFVQNLIVSNAPRGIELRSPNSVGTGLSVIGLGEASNGASFELWSQVTLSFVTSINHFSGVYAGDQGNTTLSNALLGVGENGMFLFDFGGGGAQSNNQFSRLAISIHNNNGIYLRGAETTNDDNRFLGELWMGNSGNSNCVDEGIGPIGNWLDGACNYGSSTPVIPADSTTLDLNGILIGQVATDPANVHGGTASSTYASITDWTHFSSPYRGWATRNTGQATEFHLDHRETCRTGETCHIWDVRYSSAGSVLKNVAGVFDADACPSSVDAATAANVITDSAPTPRTFLVSAMEIIGDFIGNDNGLCESDEECIFAPHVGSYLGEGDYKSNGSCSYAGGNGVTNYIIYGYPITEGSEN